MVIKKIIRYRYYDGRFKEGAAFITTQDALTETQVIENIKRRYSNAQITKVF